MKNSISLPFELWQRIFLSFQSDTESDNSCVSLALTCKTCRCAFALTKQESCKKAALKRLLQWRALSDGGYAATGNTASIRVRATLAHRKTVRLIEWLETGYITVSDFLQAQNPCALAAETNLSLLLAEKSPKILDEKAVQNWMVEIINLVNSRYQEFAVFHALSGEVHWCRGGCIGGSFKSGYVSISYFPSDSDCDSSS